MVEINKQSIQTKLQELRKQERSGVQRLEAVRADIAVLERTLVLFSPPKRRSRTPADLHVTPDEVKGMKPEAACVLIATRNDGELRSTAARSFLVAAGVLRAKDASPVLYAILSESPHFRRVSRGVYRYTGKVEPAAPPEPQELPPEHMKRLQALRGDEPDLVRVVRAAGGPVASSNQPRAMRRRRRQLR